MSPLSRSNTLRPRIVASRAIPALGVEQAYPIRVEPQPHGCLPLKACVRVGFGLDPGLSTRERCGEKSRLLQWLEGKDCGVKDVRPDGLDYVNVLGADTHDHLLVGTQGRTRHRQIGFVGQPHAHAALCLSSLSA